MADIVQKFKTPSGDNIIDKDFADFKGSGGTVGGNVEIKYYATLKALRSNEENKYIWAEGNFSPWNDLGEELGTPEYRWKDIHLGNHSKNINGFTFLPNGMLMQWGYSFVNIETGITFPIAYSHNNYNVVVTPYENIQQFAVKGANETGFRIITSTDVGTPYYWNALGWI